MSTVERRPALQLSDRDRAIWAHVEQTPGAVTSDLILVAGLSRPRLRRRLAQLADEGYLHRAGPDSRPRYSVARPLPAPTRNALRVCPDCRGAWRPGQHSANGPVCVACRRMRAVVARARLHRVPHVRVVRRRLASRARAPHPLRPGELVWVDGPGDIDAIAADARLARAGAVAA